jgi:hypothetical protein
MTRDSYEIYLEALAKKRAPALAQAIKLVIAERYDEAEQTVTRVDDSIYAGVAIAKMYRDRLTELVAQGQHRSNPAQAEAVFHRALSWARSCYPEAHTHYEADDYERGRAKDLADLTQILGYHPDPQ